MREVFESSLRLARQSGYLKKRGMRVALDTTYILGRGAVQDTYNLLEDGIVKLLRALAAGANTTLPAWAEAQGYERYFGSSIKGEATIDWSDRKARRKLLGEIVADADRLLELARQAWVELPEDSAQRQSIVDGAELLGQLLPHDPAPSGLVRQAVADLRGRHCPGPTPPVAGVGGFFNVGRRLRYAGTPSRSVPPTCRFPGLRRLKCGKSSPAAGVEKLVLVHIGPHRSSHGPMEQGIGDISRIYDGEIVFSEELMQISL